MTILISISENLTTLQLNQSGFAIITNPEEDRQIREIALELEKTIKKHIQSHED